MTPSYTAHAEAFMSHPMTHTPYSMSIQKCIIRIKRRPEWADRQSLRWNRLVVNFPARQTGLQAVMPTCDMTELFVQFPLYFFSGQQKRRRAKRDCFLIMDEQFCVEKSGQFEKSFLHWSNTSTTFILDWQLKGKDPSLISLRGNPPPQVLDWKERRGRGYRKIRQLERYALSAASHQSHHTS